jgi:hypothetical protein
MNPDRRAGRSQQSGAAARFIGMTRRILDRQQLNRRTEASKRMLERARGAPKLGHAKPPSPPKPGKSPGSAGRGRDGGKEPSGR